MRLCSPSISGQSSVNTASEKLPCAMASVEFVVADATRWASSSTTQSEISVEALDLLEADNQVRLQRLGTCAYVLRKFALPYVTGSMSAIAGVEKASPFRNMVTPGGFTMSVALTNCG